jgi:uncharacterized cupredoxin-like copper-binding protein
MHGMRKMIALTVVATIAGACGGGEQTQTAESASPRAAQRVEVTAVDFAFEGVPETLEAGEITFVLTNKGQVRHEMYFGRMPPGVTIEEAALGPGDSGTEQLPLQILPTAPGASDEVTLEFEPGRYGYVCTLGAGKNRHSFRGMLGEFTVE